MTQGALQIKIAQFLFSYRTTPQSTTGVSPAELLMERKLRSAFDLIYRTEWREHKRIP